MESLPILPLRNSVLFPASVVPVNVGRMRSVRLIDEAFDSDRPTIGVVAQKSAEADDPGFEGTYEIGTVARVLKVIRLSSGSYSVVLQGVCRFRTIQALEREPCLRAKIERLPEKLYRDEEIDALTAHLREITRRLTGVVAQVPKELVTVINNVQEPGALADLIASNLPLNAGIKQGVLEALDLRERLRKVAELVTRQLEVHRVKHEISTMVQEEMSRSQRELLLRQQLRAIRRELGESEDEDDEIDALRERVAQAQLPSEADKAAKKQLSRMRTMASSGAEYHVARTYVEWLVDLPWTRVTSDRLDVAEARRVLDEDHYGLERIKRRIIEYIAVRKLRSGKRGPILCFVGPPGVGKTSLGRSIARATSRNFVRISLGGVQDEAEIRGHRRTYVGSLPGRVISGLKKANASNPVFILDEIDKLGNDYRGDPASALLEVLDPEQNSAFVDHYIEVPVNLSQVLFIATANRKDTIPGPLLDRMEVIEIPGYTFEEKKAIARQFLIPKQLSEHGLSPTRLDFDPGAVDTLIDEYTAEAGVRRLEREVASMCRAVAVRLAGGEDVSVIADSEFVKKTLGAPRNDPHKNEKIVVPGIATGLAWTPAGGDVMYVESSRMPGTGQIHLTGQMGAVMKESVAAAFTYLRARASSLGLPEDFLSKMDVHVHLPKSGIPKDNASVGLPIVVSLASMLTQLKVLPEFAVSGEITLRGHILRVEGIKEKCLAAHRAGITHVILPARNAPDLVEVPDATLKSLDIRLVSKVDEVLSIILDTSSAKPAETQSLSTE